jgi:hypothetical protein
MSIEQLKAFLGRKMDKPPLWEAALAAANRPLAAVGGIDTQHAGFTGRRTLELQP